MKDLTKGNGDRYYDNGKIKIGEHYDRFKPIDNISPDMELLQKALLNLPRHSNIWDAFWDSLHWALSMVLMMVLILAWLGAV